MKTGIDAVVKYVNSHGGVKALHGRKISLTYADDKGDTVNAANQARYLITKKHASVILGPYSSSEGSGVLPLLSRYKVGLIAPMLATDSYFKQARGYYHSISISATQYGKQFAEFVQHLESKGKKFHRVAAIYVDNTYGDDAAKTALKMLVADGMQKVSEQTFPPSATNLKAQVQRIKAARPDLVLYVGYLSDGIALAKARVSQHFAKGATWVGGQSGFTDPTLWDKLGKIAPRALGPNLYGLSFYNAGVSTPGTKRLASVVDGQVTTVAAQSAQAAWVAVEALNKAASTAPSKVAEAIGKVQIPKGSPKLPAQIFDKGGLSFEKSGRLSSASPLFVQWHDGRMSVVYPKSDS